MDKYLLDIIIILLLLIANGLLAMTEIAIISSNRNKIEQMAKKSSKAKVVLNLIDKPGPFLSTIQIGITIIGIISGVFSGQKFAEPLGIWLNSISWFKGYGTPVAFSFIVLVITYASLLLGELVPKRIALSKPEKIAKILAGPIQGLATLVHPFVVILDVSAKMLLKILGQKEIKDTSVTEDEIHHLMKKGLEEGALDNFEYKIFQKGLQFSDTSATIMMTPRIKVIYLDLEEEEAEIKQKILFHPHRYYPVFEGGLDNFKGIVDTKDVLTQQLQNKAFDLSVLIKRIPYVLEDNLGPDLIEQFINHKTHVAIVVDEYGAMQGMITLVDIFETIIGTMPDSHQKKHYTLFRRADGSWLCDGLTPIDEIEELLNVPIISAFEEADFDTLAGFLLMHFKHIPQEGEMLEWSGFKFEIIDMDATRIDKVLIKKILQK